MTPALRPYQVAQVSNVEAAWRAGHRSVLVESSTGTGKTTTMAEVARRAVQTGERVLFLAHRAELLTQAKTRFESFGLRATLERGSNKADRSAPVVCASVQTMRGTRLHSWAVDHFDVVLVDECHHAASATYRAVLEHFPRARVLGVTATPDRADGVALAGTFSTVAHRYGLADAVAAGFLCQVDAYQIEVPGMDLSKVRSRAQRPEGATSEDDTVDLLAPAGQARYAHRGERYSVDLHPGDLGRAVIDPLAIDGVVGPLLELAGTKKTVVFAVDRKHAARLANAINLRKSGIARVVTGADPRPLRAATLADFAEGKFQFLVNVMLLTEGWDCPSVECVALARPTQSRVFYSQAVGRALRTSPGKGNALLLDFTGVGSKLDLVGPEDALAGALVGPVRVVKGTKKPAVSPPPLPRVIDMTDEVELVEEDPPPVPVPLAHVPFSIHAFRAIRGATLR